MSKEYYGCFDLDLTRFDVDKLITKLNNIDRAIAKEMLPAIMDECGEELLNEEKRILSAKYPNTVLLGLLSVQTETLKNGDRMRVKAGYDADAVKNHVEGLIIEFGRPGIKARKHGDKIHSLRQVDCRDVTIAENSDPIFKTADILIGGKRYYPWDFIILNRGGKRGGKGISVIDNCRTLLTAAYSMLKLEKGMAQAGGSKKGFLQAEKRLSQEAVDALEKSWRRLYANTGTRAIVLNDGVKYQPGSDSAQELQLTQNKSANANQIAMAMGLSPQVISGTASTEEYMSAVRTAVMPVVQTFQAAINRSMLDEDEKASKYFTVDMTELLRGDIRSRYEAYRIGLEANFLQIDEIRYKEDLPPLGMNYIKLGLQDVLYDPKTKEIYTPNTKELAKIGGEGLTAEADSGIIGDERAFKDEDHPRNKKTGKFVFKGVSENPHGGNYTINGVTYDPDGNPFDYPELRLEPEEYKRVISGINTNYDTLFKGRTSGRYRGSDAYYYFEIHGFDVYNIYDKQEY